MPKAATLALMRQYGVEARGVSTDAYMGGNLLGREVAAEDVADAFVALALAEKTTGAVLTVDGGNIAAAMR